MHSVPEGFFFPSVSETNKAQFCLCVLPPHPSLYCHLCLSYLHLYLFPSPSLALSIDLHILFSILSPIPSPTPTSIFTPVPSLTWIYTPPPLLVLGTLSVSVVVYLKQLT